MVDLETRYERLKRGPRAIGPHMDYLRDLARQSEVAVEFGARGGGSTLALNYAKRTYSYDISIRRIDTKRVWNKLHAVRGDAWTFTIQDSLLADIPKCDLLLHDSLHEYKHVLAELERHHAKVRRWIVLHDTEKYGEHGQAAFAPGTIGTKPDEAYRGIRQAMDEFMAAHPEWKETRHVTYSCGMTTLERQDA